MFVEMCMEKKVVNNMDKIRYDEVTFEGEKAILRLDGKEVDSLYMPDLVDRWLEDSKDTHLLVDPREYGIDEDERPLAVIDTEDNIFAIAGMASKVLKRSGFADKASEMKSRVFSAGSYEEAVKIVSQYVEIVE